MSDISLLYFIGIAVLSFRFFCIVFLNILELAIITFIVPNFDKSKHEKFYKCYSVLKRNQNKFSFWPLRKGKSISDDE